MVRAEIITIGDEILYGQITDTNTQWISAELDKIGIKTNGLCFQEHILEFVKDDPV